MKLARKLTLSIVLGILAVMATYAYVQIRREVVFSEADLLRAKRIGLAWLGTAEAVWEREGPVRLRELIARANQRTEDIALRLVPLARPTDDEGLAALSDEEWQALTAGEVVRLEKPDANGIEWRYVYAPLSTRDGHPAAVEVVESLAPQQAFIQMSHTAILLATLAIVLVCAAIATGLEYRLVGQPLQLLRDKARRAGAGDFSGPIVLRQRDEMTDLANELNAMCARIEEGNRQLAVETEARIDALDQLRHSDRLATVGQLAAGVAHELGTPLSVISARAQLLAASEPASAGVATGARIIVEQADRMAEIIQQLLDFSRRRAGTLGVASLQHLVTRTVDLLSAAAQRARVSVRCNATVQPVLACVDQNQIQQALTNVVLNGIQAMPNGGELHIDVGASRLQPPDRDRPEGDYVYVTVEDGGSGITPEQMPHIFEPFFTTKRVGEGTGLGLAVADGIVAEHGGWITAESEPGAGTRFSIFLPQASDAATAALP